MTHQQKRTIEYYLRTYPKRKELLEGRLMQAAEAGVCARYENDGGGVSSVRSVIDIADKLCDTVDGREYLWCKVIEDTFNYYGQSYICKVVRCRFFEHGRGITEVYKVCEEMSICKATLYNYSNIFFDQAHKYAMRYGLMEIE